MKQKFKIVYARSLDDSISPSLCDGNKNDCPFIKKIKPTYLNSCERCKEINNQVLIGNWFIDNCPSELELLQNIYNRVHDQYYDIDQGFKDKIYQFISWLQSELESNESKILRTNSITISSKILDISISGNELNDRLLKSLLDHFATILFDELGGGQFHRRAMAKILNKRILITDQQ